MDSFNKLADLFRQFPGIGPRQAKRFVYFLLSREPKFIEELSKLANALKKEIVQCKECFRFFQKRNGGALCPICADPNRTTSELMIVAKDTDLEAIEKSGTYDGRYFVLGGTMTLLEAKARDILRTKELLARISKLVTPSPYPPAYAEASAGRSGAPLRQGSMTDLKEIILALSANTEGEYTSDELRRQITPLLVDTEVKVSTLGRGLSTGSELEYADKETLKSALENRTTKA